MQIIRLLNAISCLKTNLHVVLPCMSNKFFNLQANCTAVSWNSSDKMVFYHRVLSLLHTQITIGNTGILEYLLCLSLLNISLNQHLISVGWWINTIDIFGETTRWRLPLQFSLSSADQSCDTITHLLTYIILERGIFVTRRIPNSQSAIYKFPRMHLVACQINGWKRVERRVERWESHDRNAVITLTR